ncbi:F-box domain-containing protein [Podospora appendiculata]|uniref:F-box domain-containing protein n=1 Tax=Podospora appendiculata TaxID=314037 RepID=A0AAE0X7K0_9PEZI|nr:F-box domain-containing protein [Podospora appendiculata]
MAPNDTGEAFEKPEEPEKPTPKPPALTFMALPREVQKDIFSHCSQSDYICLSLVSKHFRQLAAAQLYRNFHIVFPDEDDPSFDSPIDGLAGGLETFVASDYDYAGHLRDLSLDTLSAGDKAETAYKPYLYSVSCGKFMNTLLLLTLRKARALESFRWNIRVELSRPVYRALHQINTLTNVHIRLQAGPSLYETPPPLPYTNTQPSTAATSTHGLTILAPPPPPPPAFSIPAPPSVFYVPTSSGPPPPVHKPITRAKAVRKPSSAKEPPTLSGFKQLRTLAVLDIDTLDVVTELKSCIRNSSGTLTKLKLSFSDALGLQARKPPPDLDPEDSDPDDEFQVPTLPLGGGQGYNDDASGPAKAFRAQEERKSQESVLGRIFDVEPYVVKKPQKKTRDKEKEVKEEPGASPGRDFINAMKAVSAKLMRDVNGSGDFAPSQQEILDIIEAASRKYVASDEAKSLDAKKDATAGDATSGSSTASAKPDTTATEASATPSGPSVSLFGQSSATKTKDTQKDANPEDINIEEPEEQLFIESQDSPGNDAPVSETSTTISESSSSKTPPLTNGGSVSPSTEKTVANLAAQKVNYKILALKMDTLEWEATQLNKEIQQLHAKDGSSMLPEIAAAEKQLRDFSQDIKNIQREMDTVEAEVKDVEKQMPTSASPNKAEQQQQLISDYLRSTRGLALHSLSIYLIPVKASVLSRAIDLRVLHRITLLNVGPQAPIWAHLAKENKESPLPLRKIFTDNVSTVFLTFVSQLEALHELFLLERDNKYKPEPFAPKTTVTMEQIRRLVLKKHMPTLKRLTIKNMSDNTWDINEKVIMLLCRRGKILEELACSLGIKVIHIFMQHLAGLSNLRALHIVRLRNDDTCVWVMRETKRFLVDNVSHHPEMKLEWISIDEDDRVDRLIRPSDIAKKEKKKTKKSKGKQKAIINSASATGNDMFPFLPPPDSWESSESDSDEDLHDAKIGTVEFHFYDVCGVRIFKKEVVYGRL